MKTSMTGMTTQMDAGVDARVDTAPDTAHSLVEDGYALVVGCILLVLGLVLLHAAGLVTGGIAGVALLLSYLVPWPVGVLFTVINVPFFLFAHRVMGARFAVKTVLVNVGIAAISAVAKLSLTIGSIHPMFAALVGGTVIGMGILSLARHDAGVGGTGVVTLWLQRRRGWNAGRSQIAIDVLILAAAMPVVTPERLGWSALSAAAISLVLIAWHRPDRYIAR